MRGRPPGWVARNVIDGLVVLAVLIGTVWLVPRGLGGGRGRPAAPPAAVSAVTSAPATTSTAASTTAAAAVSTSTGRPRRSAVVGRVRTNGFAEGLTFGAGSLWIASGGRLARVDPRSDPVVAPSPVGPA